jgi:hypothetical protein
VAVELSKTHKFTAAYGYRLTAYGRLTDGLRIADG